MILMTKILASKALSKVGQGFNNSRGEISDQKDTPKNNGQNLNNDPAHHRGNAAPSTVPAAAKKVKR